MSYYVYRFFDKNDKLLWVGCSSDVKRRIEEHKRIRPWMHETVRVTTEPYETYEDGRSAEARAVEAEKPKYNRFLKKAPSRIVDRKARNRRNRQADWTGGDYHPSR